jgi:hypothetical protein
MAKSKERSEVEYLRAENKGLKSQIRHLKKELARAQKRQHQYEDLEERSIELELEESEIAQPVNEAKGCPSCNGKLVEVDIGVRKLIRCESCDYRVTAKS